MVNDFQMPDSGHASNGSEKGVLIGYIEAIEAIQFPARPSWICRQGDKEFLRIVTRCFYSITRGLVIPLRSTSREGQVAVLCAAINPNQFPSGMVESGSQVMDGISKDERESSWYRLVEVDLDGESTSRKAG